MMSKTDINLFKIVIAYLILLTPSHLMAQNIDTRHSDGSFSGVCSDGKTAFAGEPDGTGYVVSAGGRGGVRNASQIIAIRDACNRATSKSSKSRILPSKTLVVFDRTEALNLANSEGGYNIRYSLASNMGGEPNEYFITKGSGRYDFIKSYSDGIYDVWEMKDGGGTKFFAIIEN